jgi:RHS repeat-associated protein
MTRKHVAVSSLSPSVATLRAGLLFFVVSTIFLTQGFVASAQIENVTNSTSTPIPGAGHDYIKMLSETVNPANGSVSVRIQTPTPSGRGISLPFSFAYDSNGAAHLTTNFNGTAYWKDNTAYLAQGGWSYTVPMLSNIAVTTKIPQQNGRTLICVDWQDYVFQDPSGGRHSLNVAISPNPQSACPTQTKLTGGDDYYLANIGATGVAAQIADSAGTVYSFPAAATHYGGSAGAGSSLPTLIEDRNGNQIVVTDNGLQTNGVAGSFTVTDPLGRTLLSSSGFGVSGNIVTVSGLPQPYVVTWGQASVNFVPNYVITSPGPGCAPIGGENVARNVISGIQLPNGESYQFSYESTYGMVNQITYPSGGYVHYTWAVNSLSEPGYFEEFAPNQNTYCSYQYDVPAVKQRTVSFDGVHVALTQTFTYTTTWNSSNSLLWTSKTTTVKTTDNITGLVSTTSYTYFPLPAPTQVNDFRSFAGLIPVEQTVVYENAAGTALRTTGKVWYDPYELYSQQTILSDSTATAKPTSQTTYLYGNGAQVTDKKEYDYGAGTPGLLLRETVTNYQTFAATPIYSAAPSIFNKPCQSIIKDGSGNRYAETDYYYDGGTALCPSTTATQTLTGTGSYTGHDETNYGTSKSVPRGNLTQKTQWGSAGTSPVTTYTYDETGQVLTMKDPCGTATCSDMTGTSHTTTYSYANSYTVLSGGSNVTYTPSGNTNAYLTKITNPLGYSESFTYDYNNGQLTRSIDENSQPTTYIYNDPFARPTAVNYPDQGETTSSYNDAPPSPTMTVTKKMDGSGDNMTTVTIMDGLRHPVQTQLTSDPQGTTYTQTSYDGTGKPYQVYNPTRCNPPTTKCGGETTWGITSTTYDALGRPTAVSQPDGSNVSTSYSGRATEVSDEGNGTRSVQRISQVDGMGRLLNVCEVTSNTLAGITPTPAACGLDISATGFLTSYGYDPLGNLTSVTQGGLNGRSFAYDSLSRLATAQNPESGTINYTYDADGDLYQRVAPAPNQTGSTKETTSYTYDALNRLIAKTYSDGTPGAAFYYDQSSPWGVTALNPIGRLTESETFNSVGPVLTGAVFSYDPMGRIVGQWQCTPLTCGTTSVYLAFGYDLMGDLTSSYNNGDNVTYTNSYDTAARLTSVKSSLSDSQHPGTLITLGGFSPIQKPTVITLGNGIVEDLAYSNRGWLYSMGETPNDYGFNIYNWTNSTLGFAPNGDILYSNDSVNGNWTYTYDDMNRLTQGVCTANCPAAQGMTYSYDRFGNRWSENVTAGSGIQPTYYFNANNQIDISGVLYDAAGNVTNDGAGLSHSYFYDAENRIIQVNGTMGQCSTAAACYVYDAEGHRVRATVNGQTRDFIYDLSGRNIDEFTPGGSGWLGTWTRGEAYAGSLHIATYANGTTEFDNSDWLSTFRARSDVSGNRIETCTSLPFGEDLTCTGAEVTPIHFTGKERDTESGNDFFGARYYTSTMGRFLTPDWAEKPTNVPYAHFGNPQSLNLYSYVQNNPTTVGDPDGHEGPDASWQTDPKAKANGVPQNTAVQPKKGFAVLPTVAGAVDLGVGKAGVTAQGSATATVPLPFVDKSLHPSLGAEASGSLDAYAGQHTAAQPKQDKDSFVVGAFVGVGAGPTLTNAGNAPAMKTMTNTLNIDLGFGPAASISVSSGPSGVSSFTITFGYGYGAAVTETNTATATAPSQ